MSPTTIPGPNNLPTDENIKITNTVSAMVVEARSIIENSLNVYDPELRRSTDSESSTNATATCSPRSSTLNPLKTFRFTQRKDKRFIHLLQ